MSVGHFYCIYVVYEHDAFIYSVSYWYIIWYFQIETGISDFSLTIVNNLAVIWKYLHVNCMAMHIYFF